MLIVTPNSSGYDLDRRIANARFDYRPSFICYCESVDDVREAMSLARRERVPVRIRSGGHQHEGMCSGNQVLIIDLSKICHINVDAGSPLASIGPGAKLGDVYTEMWKTRRLFPGGGCGDVRVGGLVQGGGWGPYLRWLGLTCDRLVGFDMVKADGEVIHVTDNASDPHKELLWAVRGGGGGNFGVVTEFRFRLAPYAGPITQFTITWGGLPLLQDVADDWRHHFPEDHEHRLTSFCRLSTVSNDTQSTPALVGGFFLGDQGTTESTLRRLLPRTYSRGTATFSPVHSEEAPAPDGRTLFHHPEYQPGPLAGAPPNLNDTCAGQPFPHKVSSCFPRASFDAGVEAAVRYIVQSPAEPKVARRYLSLHSLGGMAREHAAGSCFPYRQKPFMLQYQAWWQDPHDAPLTQRCLAWIRGFRDAMHPHTEGSFINFPDRDLVPNPETPQGRKALLRYYYAGNLETLIGIKAQYDPGDFFDFEMGIPA